MSTKTFPARFLAAGDTALVVEFGDVVDRQLSDRVLALAVAIEARAIAGVVELVPTFRSLMIHYDPMRLDEAALKALIEPMLAQHTALRHRPRLWTLPVCYGGEHGPDLDEVAERTGHTPAEVVALHSGVTWHVYTLGFLPGYPYMGDGPEALSLPRRESPRVRVPMGSVCIAFRLAGIYSLESPGGWHLLGRTPVRLFDTRRTDAVLLAPGDKVRFEAVERDRFEALDADAAAGRLVLTPSALQDAGVAA